MLRNKLFKNEKLKVSKAIHESGTITLDKNGIVQEELTEEGAKKLLGISEFTDVADQQPEAPLENKDALTPAEKQPQVKAEPTQEKTEEKKVEDKPAESAEASQEAKKPQIGDEKEENGKIYVYNKNKRWELKKEG